MTQRTFLDAEELRVLTGRSIKSYQIEALRKMGVPFLVNACGKPVVTRVAVEGRQAAPLPVVQAWTPAVLKQAA